MGVLFLFLFFVHASLAQTDLLLLGSTSAQAGTSASLNLSLTSLAGNEPSGIQWNLTYNTASITSVTITAGSAATAANKTLSCAGGNGSYTCLIVGLSNATIIQNGTVAVVTVTLAATATGGVPVSISNTVASSPSGTTISSGGTGATITVSSAVTAPAVISGLICNQSGLSSNSSTPCTVELSGPAPSGGASVLLASSATSLSVPGSVLIPAGTSTGTFTASSGVITASQTATVTATYNSGSQSTSLSLAPVVISSLACTPVSFTVGGTASCTIVLSSAAATGGASITLSSNLAALGVPASVTIPAGAVSGTFTATAGNVTGSQTATVTATYNGTTTVVFSLGPLVITSLTCSALSLGTGSVSNCSVILSGAAPAGGAVVTLASNSTALTVPASVSVPAGSTSGTFAATAGTVAGSQTVTITATYSGTTRTAVFSLGPALLKSISCSPASLDVGGTSTCTVQLSAAASGAGTSVSLVSNNAAITVPSNVTITAGSVMGTFTVTAGVVTVTQSAVITATSGSGVQTVNLTLIGVPPVITQSFNNQALSGAYFFRQVALGTDGSGNLTGPRSLQGSLTFDGNGNYTFSAQVMQSSGSSPLNGSGAYTVDTAGVVSLDSPLQSGSKVNARLGPEALVGSSTESSANTYDLFVAIPAPTTPATTSSLNGPYWVATLEFPSGSLTGARSTMFLLNSPGTGTLPSFNVTGHAANAASGQMQTQPLAGTTYTVASDGSGTISFGAVSTLLNGTKTFYISQDGNILLGGTPNRDSYDILIGIKGGSSLSNASWSGAFWAAGLRGDAGTVAGFAGSTVASGDGRLYWTRRIKQQGSSNIDYTEINPYSLNADGSGTANTDQVAVGSGGNAFLGMSAAPTSYAVYFGSRMPAVTGSGLFVNPEGIQNAGSYAPTGNPIAPGELIYLYVSGLSVTSQSATPPYPLSLGGVTVLINNNLAPLYMISPSELVALVPYATTGPIASVVVQANGLTSNVANVPVAATAPGVFSQTQDGSGFGAIRHADFSAVTPSNPAHSGEVVQIYLTGLGVVTPPLEDGYAGSATQSNATTFVPTVFVGGQPATVQFSGLSAYPGVYQINAQLPAIPIGIASLPLVIETPNAYHSQVQIAVQQ